ncbi:MAG TPA: hypothetical protein DDW36_00755 [Candidatus Magasanikbacteria bacterium]|nr:hypothetical protein [Candidatus Magasanikbacteria bacterium]
MPLLLLFSRGFWVKGKMIVWSAALALLASTLLFLTSAHAQQPSRGPVDAGLKGDILEGTARTIGDDAGVALGTLNVSDPRVIAGKVINGLLVLVGVAFLIMTLYAGFLYMTARGANEQVEKSLSILRRAIVGVAIVLLSLSITRFVEYMFVGRVPSGGSTFVGIGSKSAGGNRVNLSEVVRQESGRSASCWAGEVLTLGFIDC